MHTALKPFLTIGLLTLAGCAAKMPTPPMPALQPQIGEQPLLLIGSRQTDLDDLKHAHEVGGGRIPLPLKAGGNSAITTDVTTFCTPRNLYVVFTCGEPALDQLVLHPRDIWNRDCVELFIEPQQDLVGKPYHHVIVDAAGNAAFERGHVYPRHFQLRAFEQPWKPAAQVLVQNIDSAWVCALRIPLADLHIDDHAKAGGLWRVNFCRTRPARDKDPGLAWSWSNLGPNGFQAPARFGYAIPSRYALYDLATRVATADAAAPRDKSTQMASDPNIAALVEAGLNAAVTQNETLHFVQSVANAGDAAYAMVMRKLAAMKFPPEARTRARNVEYRIARDRPDEDPPPASLQHHIARFAPHVETDADKHTLAYRLFTPTVAPNQKAPLVIFLHGSAEKGDDNRHQLFGGGIEYGNDSVQKRHPCFVMVPQCPLDSAWSTGKRDPNAPKAPGTWNYKLTENAGYVAVMINHVIDKTIAENPAIDPQRIYIAGSSMGGYGVYEILMRWPEKFAAAVVLCGGGDNARAPSIANIPLWVHHGVLDDRVPVLAARTMVDALKNAGGQPRYSEYPDRGHALGEPNVNDNVLNWMFTQRRK